MSLLGHLGKCMPGGLGSSLCLDLFVLCFLRFSSLPLKYRATLRSVSTKYIHQMSGSGSGRDWTLAEGSHDTIESLAGTIDLGTVMKF